MYSHSLCAVYIVQWKLIRDQLHDLTKVGLHGTKSTFGVSKNPDLSRISAMLHNCPNIEVQYLAPFFETLRERAH